MEEKRKNKRLKISLELSVSSLFKQDNVKVEVKETPKAYTPAATTRRSTAVRSGASKVQTCLNADYTFDNYVGYPWNYR